MKEKIEFTTSIEINADIEKVWEIFLDTSKYSEWNPFIKAIWGKFGLNEKFFEVGYIADHIYFPFLMKVIGYKPLLEVIYEGSLPGFFGNHIYKFEKIETNRTVFSHRASFCGMFVNFSKKHISKNVKRVHEEMNLALKTRAEKK